MIGTTVGHYHILQQLGAGGMGVVFKAEDIRLHRQVAVKFLPAGMARSPQALERFQREARAVSALNHPNICTLHDIGEHEGQPFLVMELMEGQTLRERLQAGPLPVPLLVELGVQIADALDAAHQKGILHRDLKPANIFVTQRRQAKILDFGLAKLESPHGGEESDDTLATQDILLTQPGSTVGTVAYMSPEQARGEAMDARSDLFSLGVVLYEMATGQRPFDGSSPAVIYSRILQGEPVPPCQLRPELPARLQEIIAKTIEKDADLRCQSAAELRADLKRLQRALAGQSSSGEESREFASATSATASRAASQPAAPVASTPATPSAAAASSDSQIAAAMLRRHWPKLTLVLLPLLLIVGGWLWLRSWLTIPPVGEPTRLTNDGMLKDTGELQSDGARIYYSGNPGGLFEISRHGGAPVPIETSIANPQICGLSPDGSRLLVEDWQGNGRVSPLWIVQLPGNNAYRVGNIQGLDATWTPDGKQILYSAGHALRLADPDGGSSHVLAHLDSDAVWMRYSPHGHRIRFSMGTQIWEMRSDGTGLHPLPIPARRRFVCCGVWTRDGKYYVFQKGQPPNIGVFVMGGGDGWLSRLIHPQPLITNGNQYAIPFAAPGGRLYALSINPVVQLVRFDSAARAWLPWLNGPSALMAAASPDHRQIAMINYPEESLLLGDADGNHTRMLTPPGIKANMPAWAPNGQALAFMEHSTNSSVWKLVLWTAATGNQRVLVRLPHSAGMPAWSPDSQQIAYSDAPTSDADVGHFGIRILNLRTGQTTPLPGSSGDFNPVWSPDGRWLAAVSEHLHQVLLYNFASHQWKTLVTSSSSYPHWAPDSRSLYFGRMTDDDFATVDIATGKITPIPGTRHDNIAGLFTSLAPDGSLVGTKILNAEDIYSFPWRSRKR